MKDTGRVAAVCFTINGKAYVGLGQRGWTGTNLHDFWEYDPVLDLWTKKADYPGKGSYAATAFSINGKGYVGLGAITSTTNANDFWEYSPATDTWRSLTNFSGTPRYGASTFVIGSNAFVGTGSSGAPNYLNDMWMYDPILDSWTAKINFPGGGRAHATGFAIGNFGYLGTGLANSTIATNDIWKYDKPSDSWTQIPNFPAKARMGVVSFVVNNKAYIGTGYDLTNERNDFYEYNPVTNSWGSTISGPVALQRHAAIGFSIGNIGYTGTGMYGAGAYFYDLWAFGPEIVVDILPDTLVRCDGAPPLTLDAGTAFDKYLWSTGATSSSIQVNDEGLYKVTVTTKAGNKQTDSVVVNISKLVVDLGLDRTFCNPASLILDAGAPFDQYLWSTPQGSFTGQKITASKTGDYNVEATNKFGCKAKDIIHLIFDDKPKLDLSKLETLMCGKFATDVNVSADKSVSWLLESSDLKVNINDLNVSVSPGAEGTYPIILTAKDEFSCSSSAAFNLGFYKSPVLDLGRDSTICNPETITLNAGQFADYFWSTTETTRAITVKHDGEYKVNITDKNGCKAVDSIKIAFTDRPKLDLSALDTLYCGKKSAALTLSSDKGVYTLQRPDIGTIFSGLNAVVPDYGSYTFKFTSTDPFGCFTDTTFKVGFHKIPTVSFSIDSTKCYHYNLAVKYTGDATVNASKFIWVFGSDTLANGIGLDSDTIPLGINRTKRDLSLKVIQDGCSNSDTIKDIKVIPNLAMHIVDSLGCKPFNAEFRAENTEVVVYDWDFGDGTPVERKDNHPFHNYQNPGYYGVKLKVKTIVAKGEGCYNEVKLDSLVHVAPVPTAAFTPVSQECLDAGNHEISYSGNGDALDRYIWNLKGFNSQDIIQNPNETKGPLIFNLINEPQANIGIHVISKYGCVSDMATVLVKGKPLFSINSSLNSGCIPLKIQFNGKPNDPVDQLNYSWDFGDGTNGSGDQVNHEYTDPDHQYDIVLTALSSITTCSDTLIKKGFVSTHPKPLAAFNMDNKVVYNDMPTINFSNTSTGATSYSWDFGDEMTSNLVDPSHSFAKTGYRTVLLEAFNEFLCSDTISQQILVAFNRIFPPNAFSPNAPNPVDREFKLTAEGFKTEGYHFVILSRWNDIAFETKNEIKGWNGRMKNGDYAPAGNYVWVLDFFDFLGRPHRQTGTVTLIF